MTRAGGGEREARVVEGMKKHRYDVVRVYLYTSHACMPYAAFILSYWPFNSLVALLCFLHQYLYSISLVYLQYISSTEYISLLYSQLEVNNSLTCLL